jgi:hypothetical protein
MGELSLDGGLQPLKVFFQLLFRLPKRASRDYFA